ncbi:MAG: hypothetical protein JXQ90_17005 [Cyclobacteriaceae bacterium]
MKRIIATLYLFVLILATASLQAQTSTEIYVFDMLKTEEGYTVFNPVNISNNPGYDNQPSFITERHLAYSRTRNGQTDIAIYDIEDASTKYLTETEGSEYSPTLTPTGNSLTSILLEKDGTQLLYEYDLGNGDGQVAIPALKIGYHAWLSNHWMYAFVLGDSSNTLEEIDVQSGKIIRTISSSIGRSLHRTPDDQYVSYIEIDEQGHRLFKINPSNKLPVLVTAIPFKKQDMIWLQDGTVLMGNDSKLHAWYNKEWVELIDLASFELTGISRMAVNSSNTKIAIVVNM